MRRKNARLTFKKDKIDGYWVVRGQFANRPEGYMFGTPNKQQTKAWLDKQIAHLKYSFIIYLNGRRIN